jgi:predicted nucleic acid-binding protein
VTRVLLDSDVLLDLFLARPGFAADAIALWDANLDGKIVAFVSAITPDNIFYVARKAKGLPVARQIVADLLSALQVCLVDGVVLKAAQTLPVTDYEDAIQVASAMATGLDAIVMRNVNDYKNSPLPVYSPTDFLARL